MPSTKPGCDICATEGIRKRRERLKPRVGVRSGGFRMTRRAMASGAAAGAAILLASGAVRAAKWLAGKPAGLYSMEDVLGLK